MTEDCTFEKECEACKVQKIKHKDWDSDSSDQSWKYYQYIYQGNKNNTLQNYIGIPCDCKDSRHNCGCTNNGEKCMCTGTSCTCENYCKFRYKKEGIRQIATPLNNKLPDMGGDTIFNFNHKKYQIYSYIINRIDTNSGKNCKEQLLSQLNRCAKNHHSFLNFSLMPRTGAMNSAKGSIFDGLDRFDTFVFFLDHFYQSLEENIYTNALLNGSVPNIKFANRKILKDFLSQFNSIENYCKEIYFINNDDKFINRLIENGKKPIHYAQKMLDNMSDPEKQANVSTLKEYMDIAEKYWEMRHERLIVKKEKSEIYQISGTNIIYYYFRR